MIKKTVTYKDFDDNTVTEDLYFNISKSEWIEIELNGFDLPDGTHVDSYGAYLQSLAGKNDAKSMIIAVKQLIGMAYGVRNGAKFEKSDQISSDFIGSPAYDEFFWSLAMDPDTAANFMTGLIPSEIMSKAEEVLAGATMTSAPLVPQTIQLPPQPDTTTSPVPPAAFAGPPRPGMRKGHQPLSDNANQRY